jgi:dihydroorotase
MSLLAHVFEDEDALDKLEAFASLNGPRFYGLEANSETMTLAKSDTTVSYPAKIETGAGPVTVFDPMFDVKWAVQ